VPAPRRTTGRTASVKDVAARASVSLGTVSNVLNRPEVVSSVTRERVERAMADLGFVRNELARHLRTGTSSTIAYVMLDATNPFFTDVAQAIEVEAEATDVSVLICNSNNRAEREQVHLGRLVQQRVQGILMTPVDASTGADPTSRSARSPSTTCAAVGSRSSTSSTRGTAGSPSSVVPTVSVRCTTG
jgi:LacI family transcriptional regulator